ncbi:50S ribosomal protein L1 [Candidatus Woesearchaeota archaeon]|nr:50S ribosomal protein L1 [Candidatus Woesearchaeota archaeon]
MDQKDVLEALKKIKETSTKRNFNQTYDLVITLKDIDLKKQENHVDFFGNLPHNRGKKIKVCAFAAPELKDEAKAVCDNVVDILEFPKYAQDKKLTKKLADEFDFFIAQANIMTQVASAFGRVLGPKNKMPNPKAGCVVPPKTNLKPLYARLQTMFRVSIKKDPMMQIAVGKEDMKDEEIADNIVSVYDQLLQHLPNQKNNLKAVYLKLTMGKAVKVA